MLHLYLPPSLRYFEPLRPLPGSAREFIAFEYDLTEALRPNLVVDVGAGNAEDFLSICQSVRDHDLDCLCYAIDPWDDDEGKEPTDESRQVYINYFAHTFLRGIAYLMPMSADAGRQHFDAGTIDLLRIDASRAGKPLSELLDAYLPRLRAGGVALCAGSLDEALRYQAACSGQYEVSQIRHGRGLSVLRNVGSIASPAPAPLLQLLFSSDPDDRRDLEDYYSYASIHLEARREVNAVRWGVPGKAKNRS